MAAMRPTTLRQAAEICTAIESRPTSTSPREEWSWGDRLVYWRDGGWSWVVLPARGLAQTSFAGDGDFAGAGSGSRAWAAMWAASTSKTAPASRGAGWKFPDIDNTWSYPPICWRWFFTLGFSACVLFAASLWIVLR
jgi:hypothetical protein